jgi:hypothetical protein
MERQKHEEVALSPIALSRSSGCAGAIRRCGDRIRGSFAALSALIEEQADAYSFLVDQLGMNVVPPRKH